MRRIDNIINNQWRPDFMTRVASNNKQDNDKRKRRTDGGGTAD